MKQVEHFLFWSYQYFEFVNSIFLSQFFWIRFMPFRPFSTSPSHICTNKVYTYFERRNERVSRINPGKSPSTLYWITLFLAQLELVPKEAESCWGKNQGIRKTHHNLTHVTKHTSINSKSARCGFLRQNPFSKFASFSRHATFYRL